MLSEVTGELGGGEQIVVAVVSGWLRERMVRSQSCR